MKHLYKICLFLLLVFASQALAQSVLDWTTADGADAGAFPDYPLTINGVSVNGSITDTENIRTTAEYGTVELGTVSGLTDFLEFRQNAGNQSQTTTYQLTFDKAVSNLTFTLGDIDTSGWDDRVILNGYNGATLITLVAGNVTLSSNVSLLTGNVLYSDGASVDDANTDGNVTVTFPSPVTRVDLIYGNGSRANTDPSAQVIRLGDLSWRLAADLAISKTGSTSVSTGGSVSYTLRVWNNGTNAVTGATVTDTLPASLTSVSWTCVATGTADCNTALAGTGATGTGNISLTNVSLEVDTGGTTTADTNYLTFTITATAPAVAGSVTNTASVGVSSLFLDGTSSNNSSSVTTTVGSVDYGDAPDTGTGTGTGNYRTVESDGGASHIIVTGLRLGTLADADTGLLQNTAATADDTGGTDDEDGVASFADLVVDATSYSVNVSVTKTAATAYLVGFIDFNRDGDFLDTGERSATVTISTGAGTTTQTVNFTSLSGLVAGQTYARFRLSNTQAQAESSVGSSTSGEVEDYSLPIEVTMNGTVFEDVNYGGGLGRSLATSSGIARPGVRVELYDATGAYQNAVLTDSSGQYSFAVLANATYTVRVVNGFVTSSRAGGCTPSASVTTPPAGCTQLPVQTFRTSGLTGNVGTADTARVGGERPSVADTGSGGTGAVMNASGIFTTAGGSATLNGQAQSISTVTVGTANATGVNFGFNFDTVVNTNDTGQGSLRQFIVNSNALTGNSSLAQSGSTTNTRGTTSALPASKETSIFMIPDGNARNGLRSGLTNQLTSGVAVIQVASTLPTVSDSDTVIDGGTQTFNITNTNTTTLNTTSTVGIDGLAVPAIGGPEVQLQPSSAFYSTAASGLTVGATNTTVQNLSVFGFSAATAGTDDANIYVNTGATGMMIRWNVIGTSATSYADPGATARTVDYGVIARATGLTVRENIVAYMGAGGVELYEATSTTLIESNELRNNGVTNSRAENLNMNTNSSGVMVRGNLSVNAGGPGFDTSGSSGSNTFVNNTVTGNGRNYSGQADPQTSGLRITGSNNTVQKNIIGQNYGAGILVRYATTNTGNLISQNSLYANGTALVKQLGIDLVASASENGDTGTSPFTTVNDLNDTDTGTNNLLNFPVFESISVIGSNLLLTGCAPAGATIELFEADVSPGKSSTLGANTNAPRTLDYGEGETYLTTVTEGSLTSPIDGDNGTGCAATDGNDQTGMARFAFSIALPTGVVSGDKLTATATLSNNTSEFSPAPTVTATNIGLAKALDRIVHSNNATDNVYTLVYRFTVENFSSVTLSSLELFDDVVTQFSGLSPTSYNTWVNVPANAALLFPVATLTRSGSWNGASTSNVLSASQSLNAGTTGIVYISFNVTVDPAAALAANRVLRDNSATARGMTPLSIVISDTSTNGTDPDGTDNDNNPDENTVTPAPFVKLVKEVRNCGSSLSSCTGTYGVSATGRPGEYLEYRIRYYNISSQAISTLRVSDTLASVTPFQEDTYSIISPNVADFSVTCPSGSTVDLDRSNAAVTTTPVSGAITAFNINIMAATACNLTTITSGQNGEVLFKVRIP
jgi:uncharacterized repeat protein (TIGR01451 family)